MSDALTIFLWLQSKKPNLTIEELAKETVRIWNEIEDQISETK